MRALSRFILALSDLIEAHSIELRREGQRLVSFALVQLAAIALVLGGVALMLGGVFLLLQEWVGAAGAGLISGGAVLLIGLGVFVWQELRDQPSRDRPSSNERAGNSSPPATR